MLKSIGAFVCVRSREVVRFWEGPLREAPLYTQHSTIYQPSHHIPSLASQTFPFHSTDHFLVWARHTTVSVLITRSSILMLCKLVWISLPEAVFHSPKIQLVDLSDQSFVLVFQILPLVGQIVSPVPPLYSSAARFRSPPAG